MGNRLRKYKEFDNLTDEQLNPEYWTNAIDEIEKRNEGKPKETWSIQEYMMYRLCDIQLGRITYYNQNVK